VATKESDLLMGLEPAFAPMTIADWLILALRLWLVTFELWAERCD
jgi:hypothetical protein